MSEPTSADIALGEKLGALVVWPHWSRAQTLRDLLLAYMGEFCGGEDEDAVPENLALLAQALRQVGLLK